MRRNGFTLIEVILSLAMIAIVSVFLVYIVAGSIGISDRISEVKKNELTVTGDLEETIISGVAVGEGSYSISIPGGETILTRVEGKDDTGNIFRIYIPRE